MVSDISSQDWNDYKKWWDKENSFQNKLLRGLKPTHLILLLVLVVIGYMLWNQEGANKNIVIIVIGGIIILIIIMNIKQTGKLNPIPENVAWQISRKEVDRKVANNQVPTGTIFIPSIISKLIYWGEAGGTEPIPYRWKLLYKVKTPDNLEKEIIISLHPFFGYLTGIFPGSDKDVNSSDIKIVFPDMYLTKQAEESKEGK